MIRYFFILLLSSQLLSAQTKKGTLANTKATAPKLIVGIVIDQMRSDYIYRFWNRYGTGGFKKLINEGYYFKNTHYNYVPTYTGPGHAAIFSGSTPSDNGIIANEWYGIQKKKEIYCAEDDNVNVVGTTNEKHKRSPKNLLASTIGDELKISTNARAKVFGVAIKDRSAIFPAGHAADAAFWFDDKTGFFITSSWYTKQLPEWLNTFNSQGLVSTYFKLGWNTLYPIATYTASIADSNRYERSHIKKNSPTFPYTYASQLEQKKYGTIASTPHGNTLTRVLAEACLKGEQLGKDEICDLLTVSFSSPDIIGHAYGPRSIEIEDTYLRLDKEIELFLNTLDQEVGKGQYALFLTADHGAADVPNHLLDSKIPAGLINRDSLRTYLKKEAITQLGDSLVIANVSNDQVFLNHPYIATLKLNPKLVTETVTRLLLNYKGIAEVYNADVFKTNSFLGREAKALLQRGYNHQRSGDLLYLLEPAWMEYVETGTTHGSSYLYDTHVPLLFYGLSIPKGSTYDYVSITQIAPTICALLQINFPNACISNPLQSYWQKQ